MEDHDIAERHPLITRTPQGATAVWYARAFGSSTGDLDIAFVADRAATVTALLASCVANSDGAALDAAHAWDWTLNQRLQALIAMRVAAGDTLIDVHAVCARCGEAMALELDLHTFAAAPAQPRFVWQGEDGVEFVLRLPSGRDIQRWMRDGVQSPEAFAASLVDAVAGEPAVVMQHFSATTLAALDEALEAHDPLTALRLQARCPACAHDNAIACDLEALLVADFAGVQTRLIDDVARLALAFHWSEAEILALPPWRRQRYLRRLDAGGFA